LKICAGRIGQQINLSAISNDCGIDVKTVQSWFSILEQSYVIKLLQPFYKNFNKRIVKAPKLYFVDTGLARSLLSIRNINELTLSHFYGGLVENYIIIECMKINANRQLGQNFYYWRDSNGVEVDLIIDNGKDFLPIEIKSAQTFSNDFAGNLKKIKDYANIKCRLVVYDGSMEFTTTDNTRVAKWTSSLKQYELATTQ
jgi:predicted AAA+ superfamily ATPase